MIAINLLPGKKKTAARAGLSFALPSLRTFVSQIRDPWLIGAVATWLVVGGGGASFFLVTSTRLRATEARLEAVTTEKRRYDVVIARKHQVERIRDSLVSEIRVIRAIDADRYVWAHVLDQVSKALPPYTWITEIQPTERAPVPGTPGAPTVAPVDSAGELIVRVAIEGRTVDIQAYTTFLRQLGASPWLTDVTPSSSQTVIELDRPVIAFNVTVRYRVADSVYIRTVPFVQAAQ
ncbi:MAG TPA: PilN domain-containing protein [Gemmatimonadales bacterium]|nr:PilN domain-containing protein [Gemmatimonadales bacterium]